MPKPRYKPIQILNSERQNQREILAYLRHYGIDAERQNTGGMYDSKRQFVRFGTPGNSDITGMIPKGWGDATGRKLDIEVKREGYDPRRVRGEGRKRWERQIARLTRTNENGGYAFWADNAPYVQKAMDLIRAGYRIKIVDEYPIFYKQEPTDGIA